jgi:hypothetical protein
MNENQNLKDKIKENTKKGYQNTKEAVQEGKEKTDEVRHSSAWQKAKGAVKKGTRIAGSHLATARVSITLSNQEAELMERLKNDLNGKGIYPSKSEIMRAGLWSLRNKNYAEIEAAVII